jgi:hypothetical protein
MKKAILILFLFTTFVVNATTYYVATNGNNHNPGTITHPWATWQYAFNKLAAGDILYIRGGVYKDCLGSYGSNFFGVRVEGVNGTSANHIKISAYSIEKPILDGSGLIYTSGSIVGLGLYNCKYWDFVGLTVTGFLQYSDNVYSSPGWYENNVSYITHSMCTVTNCGRGFVVDGSKDYIYFTNCDSYLNYDRFTDPSGALPGGLCDGFYCPTDKGTHLFYSGCRAWNNSDDGWDSFNSTGGYIVWVNCWSFKNGQCGNIKGDGSGFKLGVINGPKEPGTERTLKNCLAFNNRGLGFDQNDGGYGTLVPMVIYNCTSGSNGKYGFSFGNGNESIIKNCISYNETVGQFGRNTVDHNSWQNGHTVSSADFVSIDESELTHQRKADGSLPEINFLHLITGSRLIDKGVDVGIPYNGKAPDLGAFETHTGSPTSIPNNQSIE